MIEQPPQQLATREQKSPVLADSHGVKFSSMEEMWRFCAAVVNSGQFKDVTTPEVALIRLQAGLELGLSPIWSLTNIMVTNGRPSVWGDGLLGLVLARPDCEDVIETSRGKYPDDGYTAICEVRRKGRQPVIREFSVKMAKTAKIFEQNVHKNYPERMLQMRARSWACRDAFADALRGLGVREELEQVAPKQATARVVSTNLILPGDPTPAPAAIEGTPPERELDPVNEAGEFEWEAQ